MTILGLAEWLNAMNRPDQTRHLTWSGPTVTLFDCFCLKNYKRYGRDILT